MPYYDVRYIFAIIRHFIYIRDMLNCMNTHIEAALDSYRAILRSSNLILFTMVSWIVLTMHNNTLYYTLHTEEACCLS